MLSKWTRLLPYCVVLWMAKRSAERGKIAMARDGSVMLVAYPYRGESISWRVG